MLVVGTGMVVCEAEAIAVVHTGLALPAAAIVDGDVVVGMGSDVNQHRVLTLIVYRIVLQTSQDGVVIDAYIVETMTRVELAFTDLIA